MESEFYTLTSTLRNFIVTQLIELINLKGKFDKFLKKLKILSLFRKPPLN